MENIIENNKLIAEFIGNDTNEYGLDVFVPKSMKPITTKNNNVVMQGIFEFDECLFHKSWDWLMPVVEKIKDIQEDWKNAPSEIFQKTGYINEGLTNPCINITYKAVTEFIKWHNENK